jgi:periplasmic protein TonB
MRIKVRSKLTCFYMIAAFCIFGFVACNSDGDKTADKTMSSDTTANATATKDSTMQDTTGVAAAPVKKKRKASIVMPTVSSDKIVKDKDGVYNRAETMPEYPGGQDALSAYINDHFDYSQFSSNDNTTENSRISFVIDENGKVMDVHSLNNQKSVKGLDDQAVKVISNMPAWTPGKVKGKNVKTRVELPISFQES